MLAESADTPSSAMIFAVGPFTACPPIKGETATIGAVHRVERLANIGNRQDRIDAQIGIGGTDDNGGEIRISQRRQHPARGCAPVPRR